MPKAPAPKPPNFWHEGEVFLHDLPEIAKGIRALTRKYPEFKAAMKRIGTLPWKKQPDGFEGLVCIILGQQVSVAAAAHMAARLKAAVKNKLTPKNFLKLTDGDLRAIGFSRQKMVYCRDLAQRIIDNKFDPKALETMNEEEAMAALVDLKGIGVWSAEIYLMFCLGKADIWPAGDLGLLSGLQRMYALKTRPDPVKGRKMGDPFAPHRTAASLIVWKA